MALALGHNVPVNRARRVDIDYRKRVFECSAFNGLLFGLNRQKPFHVRLAIIGFRDGKQRLVFYQETIKQ